MSTITVKPIRSDEELEQAFVELDSLLNAVEGTPEFDTLQVLSILIHDYESKHHPIEPPDPIEAIKFRMEQQNLSNKDLEGILGPKSKVSEVLNRKRNLSIGMIRKVHQVLGISADTLIQPTRARNSSQ